MKSAWSALRFAPLLCCAFFGLLSGVSYGQDANTINVLDFSDGLADLYGRWEVNQGRTTFLLFISKRFVKDFGGCRWHYRVLAAEPFRDARLGDMHRLDMEMFSAEKGSTNNGYDCQSLSAWYWRLSVPDSEAVYTVMQVDECNSEESFDKFRELSRTAESARGVRDVRGCQYYLMDREQGHIGDAPSFPCPLVHNDVEKLICKNDEVAQQDAYLSALYARAIHRSHGAHELRDSQRQWLQQRNTCRDEVCLAKSYQRRIRELLTLLYG